MDDTRTFFARASAIAIAFAAQAALPGTAQAQSDEAVAQGGIQDIVVTAQKMEQKVNEVGMSINAFSGNQLSSLGIERPEDLAKVVPGLTVATGGAGLPVYTLRGVGYVDTVAGAGPTVSLYMDETPLPYPIMARGASFDVQRVEVLKGPQGTLFGQNATGGAINYIANRPTGSFAAGGEVAYSSYDRVTANAYVGGPLGDTLRVRAAGMIDEGGAWQKSITRPSDSNGAKRFMAGRLLLDWTPADTVSIQLNLNGWRDKSDEQAYQIIGFSGSTTNPAVIATYNNVYRAAFPTNARTADWDVLPAGGFHDGFTGKTYTAMRRDDDFRQASLRGDFDVSDDIRLTTITSHDRLHQNTYTDPDGTNRAIIIVPNVANIETFSQEVRLSGKSDGLTWVVGGNFDHHRVRNAGNLFNEIASQPFRAAGTQADMKVNSVAAFAHVEYDVTPRLSVLGGIRYTDTRIRNSGCTLDLPDGFNNRLGTDLAAGARFAAFRALAPFNPGLTLADIPLAADGACVTYNDTTNLADLRLTGLVRNKLDESNVPFKLGVNFKPRQDWLLYATFSRGFKAGNFSPNGAVFASSIDPVVQERVDAYEAGFKLSLADRHIQLNGAAFHYDYHNKQVRGKIDGGPFGVTSKTLNIARSRIRGAELQLTAVPVEAIRLNVGATYIASRIVDTGSLILFNSAGVPTNVTGEQLPLTPKWQVQADAEFRQPVGNFEAFLGGNLRYQSATNATLGAERAFIIDPYTTIDLRAGIRAPDGPWSATLFVNNVTNKYSWSSVNLQGTDAIVRAANPPRIFGIRIGYHY